MRFFIFSAIFLVVLTSYSYAKLPEINTFDEFKKVFNKSYSTVEEEMIGKENFLKSLKFVQENNGFGVEINHFSDLSNEEFQNKYMISSELFEKLKHQKYYKYGSCKVEPSYIPSYLDLRDIGTLTPIRTQGECGSCWAFASMASVESAYIAIKNTKLDLSEQELVDCAADHGCEGESIPTALNYIKDRGVVNETTYPYNGRENQCRRYHAARHWIHDFCMIYPPSEDKIKEVLDKTKIAIAVILAVRDVPKFRHYNGRTIIRSDEGHKPQYHAVNIVGYGTTQNIDYWIIRNSWDTSWGDSGYGYIEQHKHLMEIEQNAFVVIL